MCSSPKIEATEAPKPPRPLPPPAELLIGTEDDTLENSKKKATGKQQLRTNAGNSVGLGIPL